MVLWVPIIIEVLLLIVLDNTIGTWSNEGLAWTMIVLIHVIFYGLLIKIIKKLPREKCNLCGEEIGYKITRELISEEVVPKTVVRKDKVRSDRLDDIDTYTIEREEQIMVKRKRYRLSRKCAKCNYFVDSHIEKEDIEL